MKPFAIEAEEKNAKLLLSSTFIQSSFDRSRHSAINSRVVNYPDYSSLLVFIGTELLVGLGSPSNLAKAVISLGKVYFINMKCNCFVFRPKKPWQKFLNENVAQVNERRLFSFLREQKINVLKAFMKIKKKACGRIIEQGEP
jgi:hypothetical protein